MWKWSGRRGLDSVRGARHLVAPSSPEPLVPQPAIAARFFLELALGLFVSLALLDRKTIGPGFTRLMGLFVLGVLLPAWLLARNTGAATGTLALGGAFGAATVLLMVFAGSFKANRFGRALEAGLIAAGTVCGTAALLLSVRAGLDPETARATPLLLASSAGSMLVLGLVTGAMILGHWYLVTPDLPVVHLGRLTRAALVATYAKLLLLAITGAVFSDRFAAGGHALAALIGLGDANSASFHAQLDFLWVVARVLIGLIGTAVLCHMTLATVKLKATQPATGILYAATVMVLMGELFAYVGEQSFRLVL